MPTPAKNTQPLDQPDDEALPRMSFGDHLDELRRRLIRALIGAVVGVAICYYYVSDIFTFLARPYQLALKSAGFPDTFYYFGPAEHVVVYLGLAAKAGIVLASPWIIYQAWGFVASGLYPRERHIVYRAVGPSIILFFAGVSFFYFVALPVTFSYFALFSVNTTYTTPHPSTYVERLIFPSLVEPDAVSATLPSTLPDDAPKIPVLRSDPTIFPPKVFTWWYNVTDNKLRAHVGSRIFEITLQQPNVLNLPQPRLENYLDFVTLMGLIFGLMFELPMVMVVMVQTDIIRIESFAKARKFAYFGASVAAMIAAPSPDVLTMFTLMFPIIGLYEVGILMARFFAPKREETGEGSDTAAE